MLALLAPPVASSQPKPVPEPPLAEQMDWDLTANGMLYVSYDLDKNERADYYTLRLIFRNFSSTETVAEVGKNFPDHIVFFVNYGSTRFFYVVEKEPFYYAFDVNEDGTWDALYKDVDEDGVNGNEEFYNSPSGMFTDRIPGF